MKKTIYVTGDPLLDVYHVGYQEGLRFYTKEKITKYGGAFNVQDNLLFIADRKLNVRSYNLDPPPPKILTLNRLVNEQTHKVLVEFYNEPIENRSIYYSDVPWNPKPIGPEVHCLVISDYNKGMVNEFRHDHSWSFNGPLAIVDSRYRSTDLSLIYKAKTKIWRCTDKEYDAEWAKNFDYVVWTAHDQVVKVLDSEGTEYRIPVPAIEVVDACGAGDTFTAALAAYLTYQSDNLTYQRGYSTSGFANVKFKTICDACQFAIECAQDVCTKPYTAITTKKLQGIM